MTDVADTSDAPADDAAIVLVVRATVVGVDARSVRELLDAVTRRAAAHVTLAYLDQGTPSLHEVLDQLVRGGHERAVLVPMSLPDDSYLRIWTERAVANWRETRACSALTVTLATGPATTEAMADLLVATASGPTTAITASPRAFRSPAWSTYTRPARQLLVCRGPRCTVYGAEGVRLALKRATPPGDESVLVTATGCLGPCNLGPLVIEHPGGVWHERVDEDMAANLLGRTTGNG